jgi:hypothetical protein
MMQAVHHETRVPHTSAETTQPLHGDALRKLIVAEAVRDAAFRAELFRDGRRALCERFGSALEEGFEVRVYEETAESLYLVLPFTTAEAYARSLAADDPAAQVISRALNNPAFRAELKSNPKRLIEQEFEVTLPANLSVQVLEDTAHALNIVLPSTNELAIRSPEDVNDVLRAGEEYTMWGGSCCTTTDTKPEEPQ